MCTDIYIYTYIFVHVECQCIYVDNPIVSIRGTHIQTYIYIYIHISYIYILIHMSAYIYVYIYIFTIQVYVYVYTYVQTYVCSLLSCRFQLFAALFRWTPLELKASRRATMRVRSSTKRSSPGTSQAGTL